MKYYLEFSEAEIKAAALANLQEIKKRLLKHFNVIVEIEMLREGAQYYEYPQLFIVGENFDKVSKDLVLFNRLMGGDLPAHCDIKIELNLFTNRDLAKTKQDFPVFCIRPRYSFLTQEERKLREDTIQKRP